ncbi:MAG TPA: serine hydrolase domain-containing protein [Thermoanaerobaculia bacterium]|jgi:CubicO group peptidase (beta-lactamase class C family)
MKRTAIAAAVLAAIVAGAVWYFRGREEPPQPKAEVVAGIDGYLSGLTSKGFAGAVLLENDGEVLLDKAYGAADRTGGRPVTTATGFDIGSLVKPFTATAILKLESRGKLRRSDSISRFFPSAPPDKTRITVQQLLEHTSGLPDIVDAASKPLGYTQDYDYEPVSRDEMVRRVLNAKLLSAPGEKSRYSNSGYSLLGAIIEIASGEPYEQFVRETIFEPAGMTRTGYLAPGWQRSDLAVGYLRNERWGTPLDHRWLSDGPSWNLRANGGMLSTTADLAKWIHALAGETLLTAAEKKALFDLYVHRNKRGARTMGAAGSNDVFDACYLWYVDENRLLVMLTSSDAWRAEEMIPDLAKRMRRIQRAR